MYLLFLVGAGCCCGKVAPCWCVRLPGRGQVGSACRDRRHSARDACPCLQALTRSAQPPCNLCSRRSSSSGGGGPQLRGICTRREALVSLLFIISDRMLLHVRALGKWRPRSSARRASAEVARLKRRWDDRRTNLRKAATTARRQSWCWEGVFGGGNRSQQPTVLVAIMNLFWGHTRARLTSPAWLICCVTCTLPAVAPKPWRGFPPHRTPLCPPLRPPPVGASADDASAQDSALCDVPSPGNTPSRSGSSLRIRMGRR